MHEPKPKGPIGNPHEALGPEELKTWNQLIDECPLGVLTSADRALLTVASILLTSVHTRQADTKKIGLLLRCLVELGMTPASRSKVQVGEPKEEANAFAAI